ncbi:MAG: hypothetical protein AAGD25_07055 [Cyanobacteria bacterium P01_F01_bin.150]
MSKSAFQPTRKAPSKQDSQAAFFSPSQKEQPFFQKNSTDTIQARLESDAVRANMKMQEDEAGGSMEMQEDEAGGSMDAPQEEDAQADAAA